MHLNWNYFADLRLIWPPFVNWVLAVQESVGSYRSLGGRASGPYVSGRILNLGADWQTVFADGVAELDTRYAIETDAGSHD